MGNRLKKHLRDFWSDFKINIKSPGAIVGALSAVVTYIYSLSNFLDAKYTFYIKLVLVILGGILLLVTLYSVFSTHRVVTSSQEEATNEKLIKTLTELTETISKISVERKKQTPRSKKGR